MERTIRNSICLCGWIQDNICNGYGSLVCIVKLHRLQHHLNKILNLCKVEHPSIFALLSSRVAMGIKMEKGRTVLVILSTSGWRRSKSARISSVQQHFGLYIHVRLQRNGFSRSATVSVFPDELKVLKRHSSNSPSPGSLGRCSLCPGAHSQKLSCLLSVKIKIMFIISTVVEERANPAAWEAPPRGQAETCFQ